MSSSHLPPSESRIKEKKKNPSWLDSSSLRVYCTKPRWRALRPCEHAVCNLDTFYLISRIPFAWQKEVGGKQRGTDGEGQKQSAHKRAPWLGGEGDGWRSRSSFLTQTRSWGVRPHPSAWPCKTQKWRLGPVRPLEQMHQHGESSGRLPRRLQGLEQSRVCVHVHQHSGLTDSTSWEAQGMRETEALRR